MKKKHRNITHLANEMDEALEHAIIIDGYSARDAIIFMTGWIKKDYPEIADAIFNKISPYTDR